MKNLLSLLLCGALMFMGIPFASAAVTSTPNSTASVHESLKILCIGNSFGVDTMEYVADVAKSLGVKNIKLGTLYIGGCSINRHYTNAVNNYAYYEYFVNTGNGWSSTYNHAIRATIESDDWDWISIQHGTGDGSVYADASSYTNLSNLLNYVKAYAPADTKLAFNMTWVGEKSSNSELVNSFNNDTVAYYNAITALTRDVVLPNALLDVVSPTGTAIQNARTAPIGLLTRDGYHLSLSAGRYIAAMTFFKALTGADISNIDWCPPNMSAFVKAVSIEAVNNAHKTPFAVTASVLEKPPFTWPENVTYGEAATPANPFYAHAAKTAPQVAHKLDLLSCFNFDGASHPVINTTTASPNGLGLNIDLSVTPYLYYSFAVQPGADFTFSIYSNTTYSPWLMFLDASQGNAVLNQSGEAWDAAFENGRRQYATTSQTGCIDMRQYCMSDALKWIITQMKLYGSKDNSDVVISYFFFGSAGQNVPYVTEGENLLPASADDVLQASGHANVSVSGDRFLTLSRAEDSSIAWPSVRVNTARLVDLSQTPYLHLKMTPANGAANGFLYVTYADGNTAKLQLSDLVKGTNVDFTAAIDVYVDLTKALGTKDVVTLDYYTLSVYGVVDAAITWESLSLCGSDLIRGDVNGDGVVTSKDATVIFRHILDKLTLTGKELAAADYDGNGQVTTYDVRKILTDIVSS